MKDQYKYLLNKALSDIPGMIINFRNNYRPNFSNKYNCECASSDVLFDGKFIAVLELPYPEKPIISHQLSRDYTKLSKISAWIIDTCKNEKENIVSDGFYVFTKSEIEKKNLWFYFNDLCVAINSIFAARLNVFQICKNGARRFCCSLSLIDAIKTGNDLIGISIYSQFIKAKI